MPSKKSPGRFWLYLGFTCLLFIIILQKQIKGFFDFQIEKAKIYKENFLASGDPKVMQRLRPISMAKEESELEMYFDGPFLDFTLEEWQGLWDIVFGIYQKAPPAKPGLPAGMRQLTQQELTHELIVKYPQPFSHFGREQWEQFFSVIKLKAHAPDEEDLWSVGLSG